MQIVERAFTRRLVGFAQRFALVLFVSSIVWPFVARTGAEVFRLFLPPGRFHGYDVSWLSGLDGIHDMWLRFGDEMAGPIIELYGGLVAIGWAGPIIFLLCLVVLYRHPAAPVARLPLSFLVSLIFKVARDRRTDLMLKARAIYFLAAGLLLLLTTLAHDLESSRGGAWFFAIGQSDVAAAGVILGVFNMMGACLVLLGFLLAWRTANIRVLPEPAP